MLPIIIGLAAIVTYAVKPKCSVCKSKFTSNVACMFCGKEVCESCSKQLPEITHKGIFVAPAGRSCKQHIISDSNPTDASGNNGYTQRLLLVVRMMLAIDASSAVQVYSKNYKGKVDSPRLNKAIATEWFNNKEDAEQRLRVLAAWDYCTLVQQVDYQCRTEASGNFKYKTWQASGLI